MHSDSQHSTSTKKTSKAPKYTYMTSDDNDRCRDKKCFFFNDNNYTFRLDIY